jgi:hypothetical protein
MKTTTEPRACERCKGEKTITREGFTSLDGVVYPTKTEACYRCNGAGTFPAFDDAACRAILDAILIMPKTGKNAGKAHLRTTPPKGKRFENVADARAYYVWRMARFNGGIDNTLPMTAQSVISGDPFAKECDETAEQLSQALFGTKVNQAWRRELTGT